MKRVLSALFGALGFVGMFLVLGAAGASDCGEMTIGEAATFSCSGTVLIAVSVLWHKKIAACGGTQTTKSKT